MDSLVKRKDVCAGEAVQLWSQQTRTSQDSFTLWCSQRQAVAVLHDDGENLEAFFLGPLQ